MDRKAMANETLEIMKRGYYEPSFRKDMGHQSIFVRAERREEKAFRLWLLGECRLVYCGGDDE